MLFMLICMGFAACNNSSSFSDGDEFIAQTEEGVDMLFRIISVTDKTVQVGNGDSKLHPQLNELAAIDQEYYGKVTIPHEVNGFRVIRIAKAAFFKCKIEYVDIEDGIEALKENAFFDCENLNEIIFPQSLKSIENAVFFGCSSLAAINIPQNVDYIAKSAFSRANLERITVDKENKKYDSREDCNAIIITATNTLMQGCKNTKIPNSITTIGEGAFSGAPLRSIDIPESVEYIKDHAFNSCNLENIHIPKNVEEIGLHGVFYLKYVKSISVDKNNKRFDSRNNCNAIIESSTNTLISGCSNTVIPSGVEKIGDNAFWSSRLKKIHIPSNVKEIGNHAFYMSDLQEITLSEGLKTIGSHAFEMTDIKNLTIPASVDIIGTDIIDNCYKIEHISVTEGNRFFDSRNNCNAIIHTSSNSLRVGCKNTSIPNGIIQIEELAFDDSRSPSKIVIPETVKEIDEDAFMCYSGIISSLIQSPNDINEDFDYVDTLYVPMGTKDKYLKAKGWNKAKNIIELEN